MLLRPFSARAQNCVLRLLGLLAFAGCDLPFPPGAYDPEPVDVDTVATDAGRAPPDAAISVLGGLGGTAGGTGGTAGGIGGLGGGDGGSDDGGVIETPLQVLQRKLSGDYWLRVDAYNTSRGSAMTVTTHAITFMVAKVGVVDGALKMYDRQCFIDLQQSGATTTISAAEQSSIYPAVRTLTVQPESGQWSSNSGPYALGWDYDFSRQPDRNPPTSDSDPLVVDPAGDGPGVNVTVRAGLTCSLRVVQKVALLFSGTLANEQLATGSVVDHGSVQEVLKQDALCPTDTTKLASGPDTVRFARPTVALTDKLPCPTRSQFMALLPNP